MLNEIAMDPGIDKIEGHIFLFADPSNPSAATVMKGLSRGRI